MALSLALAAKCKAFFVRSLSVGAVAFGLFALTHCSSSKQSCDGLPPSTTATIDGESACFLASMATSTGPLTAPTVPCAAAGCTGNYSYCSLDTSFTAAYLELYPDGGAPNFDAGAGVDCPVIVGDVVSVLCANACSE